MNKRKVFLNELLNDGKDMFSINENIDFYYLNYEMYFGIEFDSEDKISSCSQQSVETFSPFSCPIRDSNHIQQDVLFDFDFLS